MSFWKTKEGKILSHGIHDHNGGIGVIKGYIEYLKNRVSKKELTDEILVDKLDRILVQVKRCQDAIDYIYVKFKEEYEKELKE